MEHGHRSTAQRGCKCDQCLAADRRYAKMYRYRIANGETPLVDASEAAEHLRNLKKQRVSFRRMAFLSGIPAKGLSDVARGAVKRTTQERIDKMLKIRPDFRQDRGSPKEVAFALGSVRRIRSLIRVGYTNIEIAEASGIHKSTICKLLNYKQDQRKRTTLSRNTHDGIKRAFDALDPRGPVPQTPRARVYYEANRRRGIAMGWPTPAMWDDPDNPRESHRDRMTNEKD